MPVYPIVANDVLIFVQTLNIINVVNKCAYSVLLLWHVEYETVLG